MPSSNVIEVTKLGKTFKLYATPWQRLFNLGVGCPKYKLFEALTDITFTVERGSCFGVIGANGAGKSTLLKILTGSLYASQGSFSILGRTLSLLELGTGFSPELSGRQNLFNSAALLGFPDLYMHNKITEIENFAEINDYFDRPLKQYSSGMQVRLAFSMFISLEPEVLIVDEALSVGDIFFQQKCFARMREIMASGTTCLLVSHDMGAIQNLCDKVLLLKGGRNIFIGDSSEAVSRYYASVGEGYGCAANPALSENSLPVVGECTSAKKRGSCEVDILKTGKSRHGDRLVEIVAAYVLSQDGLEETLQVEMLQEVCIISVLKAHQNINNLSAGINLYDRFGTLVYAAGCRQLKKKMPDLQAGEELTVYLRLKMNVQPGEYSFSLGVSSPDSGPDPNTAITHDRHEQLGPLIVIADFAGVMPFYGMVQLPMKISFSRKQEGYCTAL